MDRLDYLETIRKQDQQLKLFLQILEKIQTHVTKDSNYSNIDQIRREAIWNEDSGKWILPEMSNSGTTTQTTLPNANHSKYKKF